MIHHKKVSNPTLRNKIRKLEITFGGHKEAKIYGTLRCKSGKRMRMENRVFFTDEEEALKSGYRPCGNCMNSAYQNWKNGTVS